jgi:DNA-binding XRE family transcriptional regulator
MSAENDQPLTLMNVRKRAGLTQQQFANLLGVTISTVSNWERGVQVPRLTFAQTRIIMEQSGLTIAELAEAFSNTYRGNPLDTN